MTQLPNTYKCIVSSQYIIYTSSSPIVSTVTIPLMCSLSRAFCSCCRVSSLAHCCSNMSSSVTCHPHMEHNLINALGIAVSSKKFEQCIFKMFFGPKINLSN